METWPVLKQKKKPYIKVLIQYYVVYSWGNEIVDALFYSLLTSCCSIRLHVIVPLASLPSLNFGIISSLCIKLCWFISNNEKKKQRTISETEWHLYESIYVSGVFMNARLGFIFPLDKNVRKHTKTTIYLCISLHTQKPKIYACLCTIAFAQRSPTAIDSRIMEIERLFYGSHSLSFLIELA